MFCVRFARPTPACSLAFGSPGSNATETKTKPGEFGGNRKPTNSHGQLVPRLLVWGQVAGWHYLIISRMPGQCLRSIRDQVRPEDRVELSRQVGAFAHTLHRTQLTEVTKDLAPTDFHQWVVERRTALQAQHTSQFRKDSNQAALHKLLEAVEEQVDTHMPEIRRQTTDSLVLVHADLHDGNLMVGQDSSGNWNLSGVIDFGDAMLAPALYELAAPMVYLTQGHSAAPPFQ